MSLLDKAKGVAKTVGDKAQEGAKAAGDKADEMKTKKKISELKEEIGDVVYQQRSGAASADAEARLTDLVAKIKEAETRLAKEPPAEESQT